MHPNDKIEQQNKAIANLVLEVAAERQRADMLLEQGKLAAAQVQAEQQRYEKLSQELAAAKAAQPVQQPAPVADDKAFRAAWVRMYGEKSPLNFTYRERDLWHDGRATGIKEADIVIGAHGEYWHAHREYDCANRIAKCQDEVRALAAHPANVAQPVSDAAIPNEDQGAAIKTEGGFFKVPSHEIHYVRSKETIDATASIQARIDASKDGIPGYGVQEIGSTILKFDRFEIDLPEGDYKAVYLDEMVQNSGKVKLFGKWYTTKELRTALEASANVAQVGEEQIITQRDAFHDVADNLANAIAAHFGVDIGEHSSANCPWTEALRVIEEAGQVGELSDAAVLRASVPDRWKSCTSAVGGAQSYIAELEQALNPRQWTQAMSDAWHRAIPDVNAAFEALRAAAKKGSTT